MKKYIIKNKMYIILAIISVTICNLMAVRIQFLKGSIIDNIFEASNNFFLFQILCLLLFIAIEIVTYYYYKKFSIKFSVNISKDLKKDFFSSVINNSYIDFKKKGTGDVLSTFTKKVEVIIADYIDIMLVLVDVIIRIIFVGTALLMLDSGLAFITFILLTLPLYMPKLLEKKLKLTAREDLDANSDLLDNINIWLDNFENIKLFNIDRVIIDKFSNLNKIKKEKNYNYKKVGVKSQILSMFLSYISHFIILSISAYFVFVGKFSIGNFIVAVGLIDQLSFPIIALSRYIQTIISSKVAREDFILELKVNNSDNNKINIDGIYKIEFKNLDFKFNGEKSLFKNFNQKFEKGKKYLIKGKSGSGKSSLLNISLGYYENYSGEVLINNKSVNEIGNLYEYVSVMKQDIVLFNDTIKNNITMYDDDIKSDDVIRMIKKIGLEKYQEIDNCSLNKELSLSGGEKKKIAFIRTVLKKSDVIFLDEPLANLDRESRLLMENEIITLDKSKIIIIISHEHSSEFERLFDEIIELGSFQ